MNKYDLITIFADNPEVEEAKKGWKQIIDRHKAEIIKEEDWGHRKLYHEVNHQTTGIFHFASLKADPKVVREISRELKIQTGVVRFMVKRAAA